MREISPDRSESALKHLYDQKHLKRLSQALIKVYPSFDQKGFLRLIHALKPLEMKSRVRKIREELKRQLPPEYSNALSILLKSTQTGQLKGLDLWPYTDFIQTYGLNDFKISLHALKALTPLFTAEFAVRPFLNQDPKQSLRFLLQCAKSSDVHLRRWASEGSRSRLPWGERIERFMKEPKHTLPILEALKYDPELYVRKSVANHLNDLSKDHPEWVVRLLREWKRKAAQEELKKIDWIIHRALRTLIKNGDSAALNLIGVSSKARVGIERFRMEQKSIKLGDRLEFQFELVSQSKTPEKLVVDYLIHFFKKNGTLSPKVFKLKNIELPQLKTISIKKSHHLKLVTTRTYFAGMQKLEIQVNGKVLKSIAFELKL